MPPGPPGKFVIAIMAAVAELEAELISARTMAALAAAKARGVKLGNPRLRAGTPEMTHAANAAQAQRADARAADILPYIEAARRAGCTTLAELAMALNARGVPSARGGQWSASTVMRALRRAESGPAERRATA